MSLSERERPGPCTTCDAQGSLRQIITTSPVVAIDGTDTGFPGAAMKWEADRARTIAREQKNLRETGDYYPNPRHI